MRDSSKNLIRSFEWWLTHRALPLSTPNRFDRRREVDLRNAKNVLVVRLDEIGDVVLTSPFLRELRRNLPEASITLVVQPGVYNLVEHCPYVNNVATFETAKSKYSRSIKSAYRARRLVTDQLVNQDFDLAILPRWDIDSYSAAMVTYLSAARCRVTYSEHVNEEKRRANAGLDRLFTRVLSKTTHEHEVEKNLDLIRFLGGTVFDDKLEVWLTENDREFATSFLDREVLKDEYKLIAIAPGARNGRRQWPIERFADLIRWLCTETSRRILVLGDAHDQHLGDELQTFGNGRVINATCKTSIRQAAALLERCDVFIGGDTGLMHLASAAGLFVIEISSHPISGKSRHVNSPARFHPWGVSHTILQPDHALDSCVQGCDRNQAHCITAISTEQVKRAIANAMEELSTEPRVAV